MCSGSEQGLKWFREVENVKIWFSSPNFVTYVSGSYGGHR